MLLICLFDDSTISSTLSLINRLTDVTDWHGERLRTLLLCGSGNDCYDIAADANIALTDFYSWNPAVGSSCGGL